tara:strand:+ start:44 stop:262 length:219 start_codon:yes stop_codon:yes gene_type:complete
MSLYNHFIAIDDTEPTFGYCEGCEKTDAELVECHEGFFEYCAPCLEEKEEGDAHAGYGDRLIRRSDNGWADA